MLNQNIITLQVNNKPVQIHVRENARSTRLSLKWHPVHQVVNLVKPPKARQADIERFLEKSHGWLAKVYAGQQEDKSFRDGGTLPILGQMYTIQYQYAESPKVIHGDGVLIVQGFDPIIIPGIVRDWLRNYIYRYVSDTSQEFAARIGKQIGMITVKDTHSRWGSCSQAGNLAYSWRLVLAPQEVAEYVCAHEVAHLIEMNHSPAFWKIVAGLCPNYLTLRSWLKTEGKDLFRYG